MGRKNQIFKENYEGYLRELEKVDFPAAGQVLDIGVEEDRPIARVPFFLEPYQVSRFGVVDLEGKRPDYGTCVVLLKYLLMCPRIIPAGKEWVNYRDLKSSGTSQDASLIDYAMRAISNHYAGHRDRLAAAVRALGGRQPEMGYPYDVTAVFTALPRIPILFLYNDADEQFPAQASILFEQRAEHFLDAECLVMIGLYLFEHLKQAETGSR